MNSGPDLKFPLCDNWVLCPHMQIRSAPIFHYRAKEKYAGNVTIAEAASFSGKLKSVLPENKIAQQDLLFISQRYLPPWGGKL